MRERCSNCGRDRERQGRCCAREISRLRSRNGRLTELLGKARDGGERLSPRQKSLLENCDRYLD